MYITRRPAESIPIIIFAYCSNPDWNKRMGRGKVHYGVGRKGSRKMRGEITHDSSLSIIGKQQKTPKIEK